MHGEFDPNSSESFLTPATRVISLSHLATAGETDFARARIGAKQIADLAAGAGQALQRVGRDSGFEHNFDNAQSRQRRLARGL